MPSLSAPAPETPDQILRQRDDLRNQVKVLNCELSSLRAQLKKCQLQRERFHSQLRSKRGGGFDTPP